MGNLRLGRRKEQVVVICDKKSGEQIKFHVDGFDANRNEYKLSINASDRYSIDREEIYVKKRLQKNRIDCDGEISGNR
jgi:sRNA-binding carbon storage regulator CsrA